MAESAVAQTDDRAAKSPTVQNNPLEFGDAEGIWGNLFLHYRLRPEFRNNGDLDGETDDAALIGYQRARVGLGLNYGTWLKTFVQFQDARTLGYLNSSVAYGGNSDLHQAWVQLGLVDQQLYLKIGRQQLVYGDQRLIGHLEWVNSSRVFDALVLKWKYAVGQLDLFASVFSADRAGNLIKTATTFTGIYNTLFFWEKTIVWDQYLLGLFDGEDALPPGEIHDPPATTPAQGPDRAVGTAGTRARYQGESVTAGIEAAFQFGNFNSDEDVKHAAVALHGDVRYTLSVATKPYIRVEGNYATGDDSDTDHKRFLNLFPTNHLYYGYMDLASWSNTINFSAGLGFAPSTHLIVSVDYWLLARATTEDGWYNAGGKNIGPEDPGQYGDDKLLGHEVDLTIKTPISKQFKVVTGASFFMPDGYAKARGEDVQFWAYTMLQADFH